jgi:hypothetical protein
MTDRVDEEHASIEDIRLGIMEDLLTRFLADEIDLRQLNEFVTISRLQYQWDSRYSAEWLRGLTAHHLFFYRVGDWPESTLRESLAFLLHEALEGECDWRSPMVGQQWIDLLKAGHVPPGAAFHQHTKESLRAMPPEQRAQLRKELGMDR